MDELRVRKRRKRSRNERTAHDTNFKRRTSPYKAVATNVVKRVNTTQKLFEKQASRSYITHGRITTKPGLFNQGKCTSFVQRAFNLSPGKKARMDQDLHRIIQLANGAPVKEHHCDMIESPQKDERNSQQTSKCCDSHKMVATCQSSSSEREIGYIACKDKAKRNKSNKSIPRNEKDDFEYCAHGNSKKKESSQSSSNQNRTSSLGLLSSSSSDCVASSPLAKVNYCLPSVDVYEKFANSIVSGLDSKMTDLFATRDYLQEARCRIKTKYHQSKHWSSLSDYMNFKDCYNGTIAGGFEKENQELNESSYSPVMVDQAVGTSVHIGPTKYQQAVGTSIHDVPSKSREVNTSEYSPFACTLSPKTTILNPIEYLKRVEKANKAKEIRSADSGHETTHSRDSVLSNSPSKTYLGSSQDPFHYLVGSNYGCPMPSENVAQNLIYQHSNRSYIDSPQAFELTEDDVVLLNPEKPKSTKPFERELYYQHSRLERPIENIHRRIEIPDIDIEKKLPGFEYLVDISKIIPPSAVYGDCSDLLDDLDATEGVLQNDYSVIHTTTTTKSQNLLKENWGRPPSPATPEHKFYRRKMF